MKKLFLVIGFGSLTMTLLAQVKMSLAFQQLLSNSQMEFFEPLEQKYKRSSTRGSSLLKPSFAIRSKKNRLEIKYLILSDSEESGIPPHVASLGMATHLATNDPNTDIAVHQMDPEILSDLYQAQWGSEFYFRPKKTVSQKQHCKMTAIYVEGKALAYILYFFNTPDDELENQKYTLRFKAT